MLCCSGPSRNSFLFLPVTRTRMAASASLSNPFSLYNPHTFFLSSSKPTNHLSLRHTSSQQFVIPGKPISRSAFSSFPVLNAYRKFGNSRITNDGYRNDGRSFSKPSVSAQQENQPRQVFYSLSFSLTRTHTTQAEIFMCAIIKYLIVSASQKRKMGP